MERACDTPVRDMLDEVALDLKNNYISEVGTKQSFNYDVSTINIQKNKTEPFKKNGFGCANRRNNQPKLQLPSF